MTSQQTTLPAEGKKLYTGIDLLRLPCALLIVFTHTYSYDWGMIGTGIKSVFSSVSVPFFFIVSGFFITQGLIRSSKSPDSSPEKYIKRYLIKTIIMYSIWTVLTLPAAIYNHQLSHPEYGVGMILLRIARAYFLSGSMGVYWYLLVLIYNCVILYFLFKHPKLEIPVYAASVILFLFGILYSCGIAARTPGLSLLATAVHVLFGSERNFLTVGLLYMCIGFCLARHPVKLPAMPILLTALVAAFGLKAGEFLLGDRLPVRGFCQVFTALTLFLVGLKWQCPVKKETAVFIRKYSSGLYFIHFPFIILFDFYLRHGTPINFPVTLLFATGVFLLCRLVLPKKVNEYMFG